MAALGRSTCRPTVARAGRPRPCKARTCPRRRCAFVPRGNGTAVPPCCKAAPSTAPAWYSRRATSLSPPADCAASITTTPSPAGASMRKGRRAMSTLRCLAVCATLLVASSFASAQTAKFGQPIAPADISPWDISIGPDGAGLPPGLGTAAQGEAVYVAKCQACHGEKGAGKPNDALVGGIGTLAPGKAPVKTVGSYWPYATTLFDYIRRAMPFPASQS